MKHTSTCGAYSTSTIYTFNSYGHILVAEEFFSPLQSSLSCFAFKRVGISCNLNVVFDCFEFPFAFFFSFSFEIFKSLAFSPFQQDSLIDSHACLTSGWRMMIQPQVAGFQGKEKNPPTILLKFLRRLCICFLSSFEICLLAVILIFFVLANALA